MLLDLDGTLIDSIPSVVRSWVRWCEEYGIDPERLRGSHGVTAGHLIERLLPEELRGPAHDRIVELEVADAEGIQLLPGVADLLRLLHEAEVPTAVVTSCSAPLARARLAATGLLASDVVVTASDVPRGKPWPDPWLLGAERIGVAPGDCLVVEDAVAGLRAARAAGCRGLAAVTTTTPADELGELAHVVVADVASLPVEASRGLVRVVAGA